MCLRLELSANDTDVDGDPLSVRITDTPDSGKFYVYDPTAPNGLGPQVTVDMVTSGSLCYKPNSPFFVGVDKAKYRAVDGRGGMSSEVVVTISVVET